MPEHGSAMGASDYVRLCLTLVLLSVGIGCAAFLYLTFVSLVLFRQGDDIRLISAWRCVVVGLVVGVVSLLLNRWWQRVQRREPPYGGRLEIYVIAMKPLVIAGYFGFVHGATPESRVPLALLAVAVVAMVWRLPLQARFRLDLAIPAIAGLVFGLYAAISVVIAIWAVVPVLLIVSYRVGTLVGPFGNLASVASLWLATHGMMRRHEGTKPANLSCGAPTASGAPCRRAAGWGVNDTNVGPCRDHIG